MSYYDPKDWVLQDTILHMTTGRIEYEHSCLSNEIDSYISADTYNKLMSGEYVFDHTYKCVKDKDGNRIKCWYRFNK